MKSKNLSIVILFCLLANISCKKKAVEVAPKSKTEYLAGTVSKSWKNTKAQATNAQNLTVDLVSTQPTCVVDNLLIFSPNKTYEFREGATKCNAADPDLLLKANWGFSADESKFTVDKIIFQGRQFENVTFDIVELTDTKFIGKTNLTISGVAYQFAATFEPAK